jgi:hypothetical protein
MIGPAVFVAPVRRVAGYHRAYAGMGHVLAAQGRIPDAIEA